VTLPLALPEDFRKPSCTPGRTPIKAGNAFIFGPDQPHQLTNDGSQDIVLYIVADNPIGESCYYPDSKKWLVRSPETQIYALRGREKRSRRDGRDHWRGSISAANEARTPSAYEVLPNGPKSSVRALSSRKSGWVCR